MPEIFVEGKGFVEVADPNNLTAEEQSAIIRSMDVPEPPETRPGPPIPDPISAPAPFQVAKRAGEVVTDFIQRNAPIAGSLAGGMAGPVIAKTAAPLVRAVGQAGAELVGSTLGVGVGRTVGGLAAGEELGELADAVKREMSTDFAVTSGLQSGIRLFGKGAAFTLIGRRSRGAAKAVDRVKTAEKFGVPLGLVDVSSRSAITGVRPVVGRIPIISTPFKMGTARQIKGAQDFITSTLDDVAPSVTMADLGINVSVAAKAMTKNIRDTVRSLYTHADDLAKNAELRLSKNIDISNPKNPRIGGTTPSDNGLVPTRFIREAADDALDFGGTKALTTEGQPIRRVTSDPIENFSEQLSNIQESNITVDMLRDLQRQVTTLGDTADAFGHTRLIKLKRGLEQAMNNLDLTRATKDEAISIADAYGTANKWFASSMNLASSPGAAPFKSVKGMAGGFFRNVSKRAETNPDQVGRKLIKTVDSAQSARQVREMVGDEAFNDLSRARLDDAFARAIKEEPGTGGLFGTDYLTRFNPKVLRSELGFDLRSKTGIETANELLKSSKINAADLGKFLDVLDEIGELVVPSKFLARRATIAGPKSVIKAITGGAFAGAGGAAAGGAGAGVGAFGSVTIYLIARKVGGLLNDPKLVKDLSRALRNELPAAQRAPLIARMVRLAFQERPEEFKSERFPQDLMKNTRRP